ncbi:Usp domain-containing protein [Balamuthia mandrillaris]
MAESKRHHDTTGDEELNIKPTNYMVGIDGSEASGRAFQWVLKQVVEKKFPQLSKVFIIDVLPELEFEVETSSEYQEAKRELTASLEEYAVVLNEIGVANEVKLVEGSDDVREALCKQVKENNIDVLVVGNTGKSNLKRLLLGSVSEYVVRHAECVVVVVK